MLTVLQLSVWWVAIRLIKIVKIACSELQLKCLRSCNWSACHVATGALVELQSKCFWKVVIEVFVKLQLERCWVAIHLIKIIKITCCNHLVLFFKELQPVMYIVVANNEYTFAWYCTTPSVATRKWFELQSIYTPSCKCWAFPLDTILSLYLQPDSGSSCN
jgi:hypothetical protein